MVRLIQDYDGIAGIFFINHCNTTVCVEFAGFINPSCFKEGNMLEYANYFRGIFEWDRVKNIY